VTEFVWDYRNRLSGVVVKDAGGAVLQEAVFTYDVADRRIGKRVDTDGPGPQAAVQLWTVYDGVNPYADFDGAGSLTTRYLADPHQPDVLFGRVAAGGTAAWYLRDNVNSVRQVVGTSGAVLDAVTYDSFGNVLAETNPSAGDRFKYTGREYDAELGIYYYRARYYDPATGRFLGEDPKGFAAGDSNLYRYVGNTPTTLTDPSGMVWYPGKYLYQYYREWRRGRELDARLDEVQRRRHDPVAAVMQSGGGTWSVRNTYGVADPSFDRNWRQGMGDAAVLANVGVAWAAGGGSFATPGGIVAQNGTRITGFTSHGIDRVIGDTAKRAGTKPQAILDALKNPKSIKSGVDNLGRPFEIFTGQNARVVVNPQTGQIVSVNPLSGAGAH
jgi:RHS repeat-associated protein